ncbi:hypothetical protein PENTCL1PPCAC_4307 [Pristionchus entomophagus]|uniref:Uncharacterized protein n=1 Tax=Pristionchus entomophagus TaxID=358040 RepID=A0AAV5SHM4_9BILA|nr:hypothetical protein PENTCL1PPCAC_4307 [Pristionchus entomophagus]
MRGSLIILAVVVHSLCYDITFVNKCENVVNVQYEQNGDKCSGRLLTALAVGQTSTSFNFDPYDGKTFRSGSNGLTVASTYSDRLDPPSIIYGLSYRISVDKGFDVAMQIDTSSPTPHPQLNPGGTIKCLDANCNSGKDWFGNGNLQYVEGSTVNDGNLTLTFCPKST